MLNKQDHLAKFDIYDTYCVQENLNVTVFATPVNWPDGWPA